MAAVIVWWWRFGLVVGEGEEARRVEVRPGISRFKWGRIFLPWDGRDGGAWDVEESTIKCSHKQS